MARITLVNCTDGEKPRQCAVDLDAIVAATPADVDGWTRITSGHPDFALLIEMTFDNFVRLWSQGKASVPTKASSEGVKPPKVGAGLLLAVRDGVDFSELEGKTFQLHKHNGLANTLTLYEVKIDKTQARCPVIIGGEQCRLVAGHASKHMWGGGD